MLLAGGYLGVALLTSWLTGRPIRPLFDGFAPPAAYQWVKPPRELASTNVVPKETIVSVLLGPDGNQPASVSSGDGQFALNLPAGAVPAAEGQSTAQSTAEDQSTAPSTAQSTAEGQSTAPSTAPTTAPSTAPSTAQTTAEGQSTAPPTAPSTAQATATFTLTPLDAGTLAPLPGLFADGNAYRVQVAYDPSGRPLAALAQPANALVVVPQPAEAIWFSADGRSWRRLETVPVSTTSSAVVTVDMGYYLAGAASAVEGAGGMSDLARTLAVLGVTAVLALGLWTVPVALRRRRGRTP